MSSNVRMENLKVSLENDRLIITGVITKPFRLDVPVDVVSVDGKLYAIPREFSTFGLIDVEEVVDEVGRGVRPSVEYIKLFWSGIYVPKGYVSGNVLKKLEELDNEYGMRELLDRIDRTDWYENFEIFKGFFLDRWDAAFEQAKLLIEELQKKGFKFEQLQNVIQVFGPNGEKGYLILPSLDTGLLFRGKWSPLGVAVHIALMHGLRDGMSLLGQERPKRPKYNESGIKECVAVPLNGFGQPMLRCNKGGHIPIPVRPMTPLRDHAYVMKCVTIDRKLCLALSYAPIHEPVNVVHQTFGVLTQGTLKRYEYSVSRCRKCGALMKKTVSVTEDQVDVVSINGELRLVNKSRPSDIISMSPMVVAYADVKPSVEYTRLASEIYVPKGYLSKDVLRKLANTVDVKEKAKLLIEELQKKGFKFSYIAIGRVEIVGPDGDKGLLKLSYDILNKRSLKVYEGKWSLLGEAVLRLQGL